MNRYSNKNNTFSLFCLFFFVYLSNITLVTASNELPQAARVISGTAAMSVDNGILTIIPSDGAIIEFESFTIGASTQVNIIQPNREARVLIKAANRSAESDLLGNLVANGQLYLVNAAGITIGENARIDAGALHAVAGSLSNSDFLDNKNTFDNLAGTITNHGAVSADNVLLAGRHHVNTGTIKLNHPNGVIGLTAAWRNDTVDIHDNGDQVFIEVIPDAIPPVTQAAGIGIDNSGHIDANDGDIILMAVGDRYDTAVRHTGVLETQGGDVTTMAFENRARVSKNGLINSGLDGAGPGHAVALAGDIAMAQQALVTTQDTRPEAIGGRVTVLAEHVSFGDRAKVDASGHGGGGKIAIGGGKYGEDTAIPNARHTEIGSGVEILADALVDGDGGEIILFAEGLVNLQGKASAQGGNTAGNGGFIEVSGKQRLQTTRHLSDQIFLASAQGQRGRLLLDPAEIEVTNDVGGANPPSNGANGGSIGNTETTSPWRVTPAELDAVNGNITLIATDRLTFTNSLTLNTSGANLTGQSALILIAQSISTTNGDISLTGQIALDAV